MRIGIFGGTFDPIHIGHLLLAEQAMTYGQLDEVWFIPAGEPPHKRDKQITNAHHRFNMLELALADHPRFKCLRIELERIGPSYTVDTVVQLGVQHPNVQFFLLIGADMVKDLPNWYKIKKTLQFVQVIALGRPGYAIEALPSFIQDKVHFIPDAIEMNVSSSWIRKKINQHQTTRYLIPERSYQYLKENHLYEPRHTQASDEK
ncbi:nicotinate-nucleotide adenylyltransferase [Hazenella sp. IB182357]|uniref:Probable nicotinate-nucleotide adenylyltransferase n=1 Tax=Polycladospora coralii TaxID=2771432 RepID=A0A926RUQ5_9BACL|nr:nicotinate-nucleotide adenylyltransferase [Polycladospora coralii]MBD1372872.1 nicotinate-nucleotide adenylyltransferase [Polycladospora coralii]